MLEDDFGDIIGKSRYGKGKNLAELSRQSNVSETRISALEAYAPPTQDEVFSLGSSLDLNLEKLRISAEASWAPSIKRPYLVDPDQSPPLEMIHTIDGHIGSYAVKGYLFIDWESQVCMLFDTGYSPDKVIAFLKQNALRLLGIGLTHAHPDHIGGLQDIQAYADVPVYLHHKEGPGFKRLKHRVAVDEKTRIEIGRFQVTARSTPGHTDGGMTYFMDTSPEISGRFAFVGDAVFAGSIGRSKSSVTYQTLRNSVGKIILSLPLDTLLFPGHGPVTTVQEERAHNPFFDF